MQIPKLPKLPKWNFKPKTPKFFQIRWHSLYAIWKRFLKQIPTESRTIVKSHQHFIVIGAKNSGKSELIQGLVDQSQDLYPFEATYTSDSEIQFYLGPKQVIQEISLPTMENKSIKVRKQIIRLWKRLFVKWDPIVVIAYNPCSDNPQDFREDGKLAQIIAGKMSLLSEIRKKPIKVRISLTHLDKIEGFLEFAHFLKQQDISFNIPLSSNFETGLLATHFKQFFHTHLSLILTTESDDDFIKILHFAKELPAYLPKVEEFLRALIARAPFKGSIELNMLSLTSSLDPNSSFNSFNWTKPVSTTLFFRYPMLKHQIASACLFIGLSTFFFTYYSQDESHLQSAQKGISSLDLRQIASFQEEVVPELTWLENKTSGNFAEIFTPHFFQTNLEITRNDLAKKIHKNIIMPEFRKALLESDAEFKLIYFLGLLHASSDNRLGKLILKNSEKWAKSLNLKEPLIKIYISCCQTPLNQFPKNDLVRVNPFLPLTSTSPWFSFLKYFQEIVTQPVFVENNFEDILKQADRLSLAIKRLRNDTLVFDISSLLEDEAMKLSSFLEGLPENIQALRWLEQNIDSLENFLIFVKNTSSITHNINGLNASQFFVKIKEMSSLSDMENQSYNFVLANNVFSFESTDWINLVVANNIEQAIQSYISQNTDNGGAIFFANTTEAAEPTLPTFNTSFPYFNKKVKIPGRYSRAEYEKKVRSTVEKLSNLMTSLVINDEQKNRFTNFLMQEMVSYIKKYQKNYHDLFSSCDIQSVSLESLKSILKELVKYSSSFQDFLQSIQYHTGVFSEPTPCLKNFKELNDFEFLNILLAKGEQPASFEEYQKTINQLLMELESTSSNELGPEFHFLRPHLSTAARISLHILQNDSKSYLNKIKECLVTIGVPSKYHAPFTKPITLLYKIGLNDLKKSVEHLWGAAFRPKIEILLSKFPFNQSGQSVATFEEINKILNPTEEFWSHTRQLASAYGYQNKGSWVHRDRENINPDETILAEVNQLASLTNILWDSDGNPKPIQLEVKSVPFTDTFQKNPIPILSYLIVGGDPFHNFNQNPSWHTIKIDWWKPGNACIGMELSNKSSNSRSYRDKQKLDSMWSFFELLKEGSEEGKNTWVWRLPNQHGEDERKVAIEFNMNPQNLFQVKYPRSEEMICSID